MVRRFLLWVLTAAVLAGCSSAPPVPQEPGVEVTVGEVAVEKTPELVIDAGVVENAVRVKKIRAPFANCGLAKCPEGVSHFLPCHGNQAFVAGRLCWGGADG